MRAYVGCSGWVLIFRDLLLTMFNGVLEVCGLSMKYGVFIGRVDPEERCREIRERRLADEGS